MTILCRVICRSVSATLKSPRQKVDDLPEDILAVLASPELDSFGLGLVRGEAAKEANVFAINRFRNPDSVRPEKYFQILGLIEPEIKKNFFKKWTLLGLFLFIFVFFKQTLQFLQQINVKNVHPVHGAGIRTHDLQNTSLLP